MFTIFSRLPQSESESQRQSTEGGREHAVCWKRRKKFQHNSHERVNWEFREKNYKQLTHIET